MPDIDKNTFLTLSGSLRSAGMSTEQTRAVLGLVLNAVRGTPDQLRGYAFKLIRATRIEHARNYPFGLWAMLYKAHGRQAWYLEETSPEVETVRALLDVGPTKQIA